MTRTHSRVNRKNEQLIFSLTLTAKLNTLYTLFGMDIMQDPIYWKSRDEI